MRLNKLLLALFVLSFVFVAVSLRVSAEDNLTDNTTNTTANTTLNITDNTTNTTTNTTANVTNTTNTTDVDMDDIFLGNTNHGMEVRLLQLNKRLAENIKVGELIVSEIDNKSYNVSTTRLKDILDDANALNDKISNLLDKNPVNVSTEDFVALKAQAINLTYEFKKELYNTLSVTQLKEVKTSLTSKSIRDDKIDKIDRKLREKVKLHNQAQAMRLYSKLGMNNSELRAKIELGNFTAKELRDDFKDVFHGMKKQDKKDVTDMIRQENAKDKEKFDKIKMELDAKKLGLETSEIANITNDASLTWEEKQTKLRILAEERKQERQDEKKQLREENQRNNSDDNKNDDNKERGRNSERERESSGEDDD
jgi:hypothetical protein